MPLKMEENRDIRKPIRCMNAIFGLFTGSHKSILLVVGAQQQMEPQNATKAVEKDLEKRRASSESSEAEASSSSLDYSTQTDISENRFQMKEQRHPSRKSQHSPDIRDVVKNSMYREARGVRIKHIDSPRPCQLSKFRKPKATVYEGSKSSKDERLALARFSYDGRESQDVFKKLKELPRFSLDSKASSIKCLPLESKSNRESGNHSRSNSIVARLMGMDAFPEYITTDESLITKIKSRESPSPRVSPSPSSRSHNTDSIRKTSVCSRLPIEPAPWKQQSYNQGPSKMATRGNKASKHKSPHTSSSIYGEIEKRIAELEFKRSGKDLRALKQILEAMQKTRESLQNQRGEVQERSSLEDIQTFRIETMHLQNIQTHHRDDQAHKEKAKYCTLRNKNMKEANQNLPYIGGKITGRNLLKTEGESRLKRSTFDSSGVKKKSSKKVREECPQNRKHRMKSTGMQLNDDQLSSLSSETRYSGCLGDTASTKSESNNIISSANFTSSNSRKQKNYLTSKAEFVTEQPSPVSVLETSFYSEGSPSPVKKISSTFREVERHLQNLNHLTDYRKFVSDYKFNQKSENLHLFHEPILLKNENNGAAADHNKPDYQSINPVHRYITKILLASPLLNDTSIIQTADQLLEDKGDPMEEAVGELIEKNDQMKLSKKIQRKIVSAMINEILARKMILGGLFTMRRKRITLQELTKEVYSEMEHLCKMPYCNPDDEDDGSIRLLTTDMKYQSNDWTDYCSEVPALVLDIERMVFKDLINEIVTCEVVCSLDRPKRHCRQLFTKKSFNLPM